MSGKTLRLLTTSSAILAVVAWLADLFAESTLVIPDLFFGFRAGDSLLHWLHVLAFALTVIAILVSVLYNTEAAKEQQVEVSALKAMLSRIEPRAEETHRLVSQRAVVQQIDPTDASEFEGIFGGARSICAYNPPLTLLTASESPIFRNVIWYFLLNDEHKYRMIVGQEGQDRLIELYERWLMEKGSKNATFRVMANMRVSLYRYPERLHSELENWPVFKYTDLRGLSFFLIETATSRKVLLYILGRPFVEKFEVPDLGLLVTEPLGEGEIFERLRPLFESRWGTLVANRSDPEIVADLPLQAFCERMKKPVDSITEEKST